MPKLFVYATLGLFLQSPVALLAQSDQSPANPAPLVDGAESVKMTPQEARAHFSRYQAAPVSVSPAAASTEVAPQPVGIGEGAVQGKTPANRIRQEELDGVKVDDLRD